MNIKDFLIENYIWILVVILLTIVTIIGFLADKKRSGKKDKNNNQSVNQPQLNQQPMNYQQPPQAPINYQPIENNNPNQMNQQVNGPLNFQLPSNTNIQPVNQNINQGLTNQINSQPVIENNQFSTSQISQTEANQPIENNIPQDTIGMNHPQPVEPIAPITQIPSEPIYQPLSEQKPHIPPRDVNTGANIHTTIPTVPEEISVSNPIQPATINSNEATNINHSMPYMNQQTQPVVNLQPVQMMQPNMNFNMQPNNSFNNISPQPANNVAPNPVETAEVGNTIPNPVNETIMNQPMNFVYGPNQNNNNQNMMQ